jgi:hypothetical protein
MIHHRNTMVAATDALYVSDDESCKIINATRGEIRREIVVSKGVG